MLHNRPSYKQGSKTFHKEWYSTIESKFRVKALPIEEIRSICSRKNNLNEPVYSWYNLKESFSKDFVPTVLGHLQNSFDFHPSRALDPFCGASTSLISLSKMGIASTGIEFNPFIHWISSVKTCWQEYDETEIRQSIRGLKFAIDRTVTLPELSTLKNEKYFNGKDLLIFLSLASEIKRLNASLRTKDFLKIGLASIIEDFCNLRKDGRSLKYNSKNVESSVKRLAVKKWNNNLQHLPIAREWAQCAAIDLFRGSALDLGSVRCSSHDLVIYSPPYLNNFDYSEIYKLELWLLGFIRSNSEWQPLRRNALRSHATLKVKPTNYMRSNKKTRRIYGALHRLVASELVNKEKRQYIGELILGYFDDMYISLQEQYRVLKPGGFLVYNVANSQYDNLSVFTDLILAEIAINVGFSPKEILPVRTITSRSKNKAKLRESIVVLQKPG